MTQDRILDLASGFRSFGYVLMAEPIPGQEELFVATLRIALNQVAADLEHVNQAYRTRGKSRAALAILHRLNPVPAFGVELA